MLSEQKTLGIRWPEVGLSDDSCYVYDGSDLTMNCSNVNHLPWTYNTGDFLLEAANMYNYTN
jgi:mannan endo-1,6-alpha-mannosidase